MKTQQKTTSYLSNLLSRAVRGIKALSMEDPAQPLLPYSAVFESLGLGRSDAGELVNEKQAMRFTTAFLCLKIISEDLGSVAHEVLERLPNGSDRRAENHPLWTVLNESPNPTMTAMDYWAWALVTVLGWGNSYTYIRRDGANRPAGLVPLDVSKTAPGYRKDVGLMYGTTQTPNGEVEWLHKEDVLHFRGLTLDGVLGLSPIATCKNAFGLSLAAERFAARFFGSGARASGVLTYPGTLEPEAYAKLQSSIETWASGEKAHRPVILEEGLKWEQITIAPEEAQMLATRQFQRSDIAGLFRVPLHLVGDLLRSTNNNIEHQSLDYIRYCLRPWAVRIEQEVNKKLLKRPFRLEHNLTDMQRGDFASQTAGYQTLRTIGVYSSDDILKAMRQNPIGPENGGDVRIIQSGFVNLKTLINQTTDPAAGGKETTTDASEGNDAQPYDRARRGALALAMPVLRDALGRAAKREKPDEEIIARIFRPAFSLIASAILANTFKMTATITATEEAFIDALTKRIASGFPLDADDAADLDRTAGRMAADAYDYLQERICENQ